jgi:hypothetical protein
MHSTVFRTDKLDSLTVDFRERLRAFEVAAQQAGADRLLMASRRALAVEALTLALRSCYWGVADSWPLDDLMGLAAELYPAAPRLPQWKAINLHRRIGTDWQRCNPLSISHEVALRVRDATRKWRWERAGR